MALMLGAKTTAALRRDLHVRRNETAQVGNIFVIYHRLVVDAVETAFDRVGSIFIIVTVVHSLKWYIFNFNFFFDYGLVVIG